MSEDDRKTGWATSGISYERDPGRGEKERAGDPALRPTAFSIDRAH